MKCGRHTLVQHIFLLWNMNAPPIFHINVGILFFHNERGYCSTLPQNWSSVLRCWQRATSPIPDECLCQRFSTLNSQIINIRKYFNNAQFCLYLIRFTDLSVMNSDFMTEFWIKNKNLSLKALFYLDKGILWLLKFQPQFPSFDKSYMNRPIFKQIRVNCC